jgi:hypothetical protein
MSEKTGNTLLEVCLVGIPALVYIICMAQAMGAI